MSAQTFMLLLLFGAGLVALWITDRFPHRAPSSLLPLVVHIIASNLLVSAAAPLTARAIPAVGPAPAVMLIAFPAIVYFLLSIAWLLIFLQRLLASYRGPTR